MRKLSTFCAGLALSLSLAGASADAAEISIPTFTPNDYAEILSGRYKDNAATISGELNIPAGRVMPVPLVIIMHGSGGIRDDTERAVGRALNDAGIATLILDSFSGRGLSETGSDQGRLPMAATVLDSFQALLAARARDDIAKDRIGITGFSRGGVAALFSNQQTLTRAALGEAAGFAAHAPVYPGCSTQWDQVKPTSAPVLFLLGQDDDLTPAAKCRRYAERINKNGGKAETVVYPGVSHQFLVPRQRSVSGTANFADCDMGINASGEMHYPALGISVGGDWHGFVRKVFRDCGKRGFTQGGSARSHDAAVSDLVAFFKRTLSKAN
jgi:dienelactone hydrolase